MTEYANGKYWPSAGRQCTTCGRAIRVGEKTERYSVNGGVSSRHVGECPNMPITLSDVTDEMRRHPHYCCDACEIRRQETLRGEAALRDWQESLRRQEQRRLRDTTEWLAGVVAADRRATGRSDPL